MASTNLEKIDGAVALIEATESTLKRVDMTSLSFEQESIMIPAQINLHTAKLALQNILEELKQKEGREPWQSKD